MNFVFNRLSIRAMVYAIAGTAILGTLALGGMFIWSAMNDDRLSAEQARAAKRHDLSTALDIALLQARRSEKDFLLRKSDEFVEKNAAAR